MQFSFINIARAANYDFNTNSGLDKAAGKMGFTTGGSFVPEGVIGKGITYLLSFLGLLFFGLAVYAGILWMTSEGNEKTVDKAINILKNSLIGLIIVVLAYAVSYFVLASLMTNYLK